MTNDFPLINLHRLTLVAFVFIPLNFATSFFGMNVQQLGTGNIHIGFFFLTAILAGCLGVLLATSVKPVERALLGARERIAADLRMNVELVQRRDILRMSPIGSRIIDAMTVPDNDDDASFHDRFGFRAVFMRWSRFHVRNLWAVLGRAGAPFRRGRGNRE